MFEINSKQDIELLKEISECFSQNPLNSETDIILEKINSSFDKQNKAIQSLHQEIKLMDLAIKKLSKENDKLLDEITKIDTAKKEIVEPLTSRYLTKDDLFIPYVGAQILYDKITLDGLRLIHTSKNSQQFTLPINVFELITILEAYKIGEPGICVDKVNELCKEFEITKMQFSKIYYNLLEDKFNDIIHEVDRRITAAIFSIQNGFIYRNDRNTNISIEEFKIMNEEYSESPTPFFIIYKIIKQSPDYNAFDIFTILRKRNIVLKLLDSEKMD